MGVQTSVHKMARTLLSHDTKTTNVRNRIAITNRKHFSPTTLVPLRLHLYVLSTPDSTLGPFYSMRSIQSVRYQRCSAQLRSHQRPSALTIKIRMIQVRHRSSALRQGSHPHAMTPIVISKPKVQRNCARASIGWRSTMMFPISQSECKRGEVQDVPHGSYCFE